MRWKIQRKPIWLGGYCLILFIIYHFNVQNLLLLFFLLNFRVINKADLLEVVRNINILVLALFIIRSQWTLFPCGVSPFFVPQIFILCLILLLVLCVRCSFWYWTPIMITATILIVLILEIRFATSIRSSTGFKNTSGSGNYFGGFAVCLL